MSEDLNYQDIASDRQLLPIGIHFILRAPFVCRCFDAGAKEYIIKPLTAVDVPVF